MFTAFPFKFKLITQGGRAFLYRLSFRVRNGSIKLHLIVGDDAGDPHIHPWTFTSLLAIGAYKEIVDGWELRHKPFSVVRYDEKKRHKVVLYRLLGMKLPCLTIGKYSQKIQPWCERTVLCDRCGRHGSCLDKEYWANRRSVKAPS